MEAVTIGHGERTVTFRNAVAPPSDDPYDGGTFDVEMRGTGLTAMRTVFTFGFSDLPGFLAELADAWRGWTGVKEWNSPERDLTIAATYQSGGHVELHFTLRDGVLPTWTSSLDVDVEAGAEMTSIAGSIRDLVGFT